MRNVISLVSLVVLSLTSCSTETSISKDYLISSGKFCGTYYNTQRNCIEFTDSEIIFYKGKKKSMISVKYEKVNDSIITIYDLGGGNGDEINLKSKDTIIMGNMEFSTNGYTSPE